MLAATSPAQLSELGQVWGNPDTFERFKHTLQTHCPQHWQPLCSWFQQATRDRGFLLEVPESRELQRLLTGEARLFSLTIVFGTPEAVAAQMHYGPNSFLHGGLLMEVGERLELSTHT